MKGWRRRPNHGAHESFRTKAVGVLWLAILHITLILLPGYLLSGPVAAWLGKADSLWVYLWVSLCWSIAFFGVVIFIMNRIRSRIGPHNKHHRPHIFSDVIDALDRIAGGDYNVNVKADDQWGFDHYGELLDKVNTLAKDLSSMERMRQEFVSNVSHEIQSPLTSISGFATLLKREDLPQEQRAHYADVIEAESKRLSKLSDNLLRLSVLSVDGPVLSRQPFRLDQQIQNTLLLLEPQWTEKKIELAIDLDRLTYTGDQELLSQVWINLLHNSIKFTPSGGAIHVSLKEEGDALVCRLTDTGCGIPEEALARIFERFYKVDKARDRSKGGNGLGLSLVQKIVELHGGKISVSSHVNKGSEFAVTLPV